MWTQKRWAILAELLQAGERNGQGGRLRWMIRCLQSGAGPGSQREKPARRGETQSMVTINDMAFVCIALFTILSALGMVLSRNIVHSALA